MDLLVTTETRNVTPKVWRVFEHFDLVTSFAFVVTMSFSQYHVKEHVNALVSLDTFIT